MSGETTFIGVSIRGGTARAYLVTLGRSQYASLFQAREAAASVVIPRSQVTQIVNLGNGYQVMELPRWLVRKNGWEVHEVKPDAHGRFR